jgi:hypothetical protein
VLLAQRSGQQQNRTRVIRIMSLTSTPGDIELTHDGRGLVIGGPDGTVTRRYFGLSVKVTGIGAAGPGTRVYAQTDLGTTPAAAISSDGYFHIPDILVPGQTSDTVTIVIEHNGKTRTHANVPLGHASPPTGDGTEQPRVLTGQTVIQLDGPPSA